MHEQADILGATNLIWIIIHVITDSHVWFVNNPEFWACNCDLEMWIHALCLITKELAGWHNVEIVCIPASRTSKDACASTLLVGWLETKLHMIGTVTIRLCISLQFVVARFWRGKGGFFVECNCWGPVLSADTASCSPLWVCSHVKDHQSVWFSRKTLVCP